jgi:L-seryl-tRNA(Ser) seleniumtransferase
MSQSRFAAIPKVDALINQAEHLIAEFGRPAVTAEIRTQIDGLRTRLMSSGDAIVPNDLTLLETVEQILGQRHTPSLRSVLNLSGTVLHTNLGRARLPASALLAMQNIGSEYSNLEYDLEQGSRGDRDVHIEALLQEITGAEAATMVNNNAAAVLISLSALAAGKQVPVSRGELVEIGGSFRIPDIMSQSGCTLHEIGTTNRTHARDYRDAIHEQTALLMKVHTSNYEINGFTHTVSDAEVATIAHQHQLPFMTDLGSGTLIDLTQFGLPYETTVQDSLKAGADIVTFSGDKLLGGPQCGLIVGRQDLIDRIKRHPLKRALRLDKITITALTEVLRIYLNPSQVPEQIPALRDLTKSQASLLELAQHLSQSLILPGVEVTAQKMESQIGSGALPTHTIASAGLALRPLASSGSQLIQLEQACRALPTPVLGRLKDGALLLDLRTLDSADDLINQLAQLKPL